jgi:hypothetical protein
MEESQKTMAWIAAALVLSLLCLYKIAIYGRQFRNNAPPDPRGIEIVLVRAPGDTNRFFIPPEAKRHAKGRIITF